VVALSLKCPAAPTYLSTYPSYLCTCTRDVGVINVLAGTRSGSFNRARKKGST